MKILIAGGSGRIGSRLEPHLVMKGHSVTILSRHVSRHPMAPTSSQLTWDGQHLGDWAQHLPSFDAIINLCGVDIAKKPWTRKRKRQLLESRVTPTELLVKAIHETSAQPRIFVQGSASGYYGPIPHDEVSVETDPPGIHFLSQLCVQWEQAARDLENTGVRLVFLRTGVVLDWAGGALPKMLLPFRLFAGGHLGTGSQVIPWRHFTVVIRSVTFLLGQPNLDGAFNITSPGRLTNEALGQCITRFLHRPSWLHVSEGCLELLLGEMASILTDNAEVKPQRLLDAGFTFSFSNPESALADLLSPRSGR